MADYILKDSRICIRVHTTYKKPSEVNSWFAPLIHWKQNNLLLLKVFSIKMWFIGECIHLIFYSVSRFLPHRKTYILLQYRTSFTLTKAHMETHNAPEFILQNHKIDYGNVLGKAIAGFFYTFFLYFSPLFPSAKGWWCGKL